VKVQFIILKKVRYRWTLAMVSPTAVYSAPHSNED